VQETSRSISTMAGANSPGARRLLLDDGR
jgi:hypothetical protein